MEGSPSRSPNPNSPEKGKTWVQFSEEAENSQNLTGDNHVNDQGNDNPNPLSGYRTNGHNPAVIEPSVEIHSPSGNKTSTPNSPATSTLNSENLQTVELHNSLDNTTTTTTTANASGLSGNNGRAGSSNGSRRNNAGFTNGDVIVSILPVNSRWPWVTPASFRPELVPEELMAPGLTLTVEEYVHAMELLTADVRFNAYTICYKRLLASWLSAAFFILLIILFSGVVGIHLFALGISWLIINAAAVFFCMYLKIKINQGLERCMARVNRQFLKHKLIVGLDDRGRISCHKVHLCFIYFDPTDCVKRLEQVLDGAQDRQRVQSHLDARDVEIVITGAQTTTRIPQKQSEAFYLRYLQRWAKCFLRELATTKDKVPLHCPSQLCPCQFVEEVLQQKRQEGVMMDGCCRICGNMSETIPNPLIV